MALINVFDEGARKVLVVSVGMICITVLSVVQIPAEMYAKAIDALCLMMGLFVTGNGLEHIRGLLLELKNAKTRAAAQAQVPAKE